MWHLNHTATNLSAHLWSHREVYYLPSDTADPIYIFVGPNCTMQCSAIHAFIRTVWWYSLTPADYAFRNGSRFGASSKLVPIRNALEPTVVVPAP